MAKAPSISVIIPTFNYGHYITEAIESVYGQSLQPSEIIVIDDGSSDGTKSIVQQFPRVKYIYQQNEGPSAARNTGVKHANGDYIAFIDADDKWAANFLETSFDHLTKSTNADATMSKIQYFESPEWQAPSWLKKEPFYATSLCSMLLPSSIFAEIGLLDEGKRLSEDGDWIMRFIDAGKKIGLLPECGLFYRRHAQNATKEMTAVDSNILTVLRESVQRKRGTNESSIS